MKILLADPPTTRNENCIPTSPGGKSSVTTLARYHRPIGLSCSITLRCAGCSRRAAGLAAEIGVACETVSLDVEVFSGIVHDHLERVSK
ncbi:hypothetical protein IU427_33205 [Nocardia beijingensis]|uniref:hypothetical protein n=1 Tax=Nocardia beijingensis TaxID=95162 RepID=UPI001893CFC2|nr:hypothetical protein [Nocardia beijingensis]MBF6469978.1 hypothetical protein [Nocardia beijingensis]